VRWCVVPCALTAIVAAQGPAEQPQVAILSPDSTQYLSGDTILQAGVTPSSAASTATFSVDGRQVCEIKAPPFECVWDAGSKIVPHQIRLVVNVPGGTRVVRTVRTKGLQVVDNVDVDAVQVTVTVTDDNGEFVSGIPRSAFKVYEDGKPQAISHFTSEDVPLEMVVAVDISGSMLPAMGKLKEAVKGFLTAVPSQHPVTLLGFNDSIFALTRKAVNPADRVRAVDRLAPWGATALYDAILRGVDMVGRQIGRKAVVVFSDGEDQGSHVVLEDVEARLQTSDITLYMIGQGRGITHENLRRVMQRLTIPTGGRSSFSDRIEELTGVFEELVDELSHQYLLGYQPTNTTRDSEWREIKVDVDGFKNVRARTGYRAIPLQ
jgi:VWFA-related protein